MQKDGLIEFHRYFIAEVDHEEGLVIDVRSNGEAAFRITAAKTGARIGYDKTRWWDLLILIWIMLQWVYGLQRTDEHAGSDGDIFSHSFKLFGFGKLIGKEHGEESEFGPGIGWWMEQLLLNRNSVSGSKRCRLGCGKLWNRSRY